MTAKEREQLCSDISGMLPLAKTHEEAEAAVKETEAKIAAQIGQVDNQIAAAKLQMERNKALTPPKEPEHVEPAFKCNEYHTGKFRIYMERQKWKRIFIIILVTFTISILSIDYYPIVLIACPTLAIGIGALLSNIENGLSGTIAGIIFTILSCALGIVLFTETDMPKNYILFFGTPVIALFCKLFANILFSVRENLAEKCDTAVSVEALALSVAEANRINQEKDNKHAEKMAAFNKRLAEVTEKEEAIFAEKLKKLNAEKEETIKQLNDELTAKNISKDAAYEELKNYSLEIDVDNRKTRILNFVLQAIKTNRADSIKEALQLYDKAQHDSQILAAENRRAKAAEESARYERMAYDTEKRRLDSEERAHRAAQDFQRMMQLENARHNREMEERAQEANRAAEEEAARHNREMEERAKEANRIAEEEARKNDQLRFKIENG